MTGAGVRAGKGGTIVSNLRAGVGRWRCRTCCVKPFPARLSGSSAPRRWCKRSQGVSHGGWSGGRPIGELGIDLAIDRDGRLWFLEANSRTGRSLFHHLDATGLGRLADRRPLEYAAYLAGFRP